jgi:hypothetical protein
LLAQLPNTLSSSRQLAVPKGKNWHSAGQAIWLPRLAPHSPDGITRFKAGQARFFLPPLPVGLSLLLIAILLTPRRSFMVNRQIAKVFVRGIIGQEVPVGDDG